MLLRRLLLSYLLLINATTFVVYGIDKYRAKLNGWSGGGGGRRTRVATRVRVAEATLHRLSLLGGSIGALLGQIFFRHKVRKIRFQLIYWSTVALQCGLILWLFAVP